MFVSSAVNPVTSHSRDKKAKMLSIGLLLSFLIYSVSGWGKFVVLQSPEALKFSGSREIDSEAVSEVFDASLGFTVSKGVNWNGLTVKNPFGFAELLVVFAIDGTPENIDFGKSPVFALSMLHDEEIQMWENIQNDVLERYPMIKASKNFVRVELGSENTNEYDSNKDEKEFAAFKKSMDELDAYIEDYEKNSLTLDGMPQINWFVLSNFNNLLKKKGSNHPELIDAEKMLSDRLLQLSEKVRAASNGKALVVALFSPPAHLRVTRAVAPKAPNNSTVPGNRATSYTEDYPAIFNIILWFSVAFIFSLIAVSYFIASMDPGRDSIIYRMTSNRMKKDS